MTKAQPKGLGFTPDLWEMVFRELIVFESDDCDEIDMADGLCTKIENIPGVKFDLQTSGFSYTICYCPTCRQNVPAISKSDIKKVRMLGQCPVCSTEEVDNAQEEYIPADSRERLFIWDQVKKLLTRKKTPQQRGRTPIITRKVRIIAKELRKEEEFETLIAPKPKKEDPKKKAEEETPAEKKPEEKDAGSDPDGAEAKA